MPPAEKFTVLASVPDNVSVLLIDRVFPFVNVTVPVVGVIVIPFTVVNVGVDETFACNVPDPVVQEILVPFDGTAPTGAAPVEPINNCPLLNDFDANCLPLESAHTTISPCVDEPIPNAAPAP